MLLNGGEYKESLDHVVKIIFSARSNAVQKASAEMISMYWLVGNELAARSEWGNKYIETLSRDIRAAFPGIKGFSVRRLKYMAKIAREVDSELCNSYCTIPWGHVVKLLDKTNPGERREWYRGEEDIHYTSGMSLVEAKHRLVAAGLEESPIDMSETELRALARKNGYELVELLQGARPGEQLLVVRCASCGRQTVKRVGDVSFGCTCSKSKK